MIYTDKDLQSAIIRTFDKDINSDELLWHRDGEDRIIEAIGNTDWKIQLDNQIPISLNMKILIKKDKWHRLIKGTGELNLKIIKM
jgi:hypothetical protein